MKQPVFVTADEAVKAVKSGDHIHLSSVASVPHVLIQALCRRAEFSVMDTVLMGHGPLWENMKDAEGNIKGAGVSFTKTVSGVKAAGVPDVLENIKENLTNQKALIDFNSASDFTLRSKSEF